MCIYIVCACVYMCSHICWHIHAIYKCVHSYEGLILMFGIFLDYFFTSLTQSLLVKLQFLDSVCQTIKLFLGMPCLHISLLWCPPSFYVGSREVNSGPYACIGNNLPLGPFPQFSNLFESPSVLFSHPVSSQKPRTLHPYSTVHPSS